MTIRLRHRVAMLLIWVLALAGTAAAAGTCQHADADTAVSVMDGHEGHAAHAAGRADTPPAGDCQCGCPCAGTCGQGCQSSAPVLAEGDSMPLHAAALPALPRGAVSHATTHPPLRPPAASI